jgi:succinoglycan biosynthesis transport protein ExoP
VDRPAPAVAEILASESARKIFDSLQADFEYIIIDLPSIAVASEIRVVQTLCDSLLMVIEWGNTPKTGVTLALIGAGLQKDKLLGAVLNKVNVRKYAAYARGMEPYY